MKSSIANFFRRPLGKTGIFAHLASLLPITIANPILLYSQLAIVRGCARLKREGDDCAWLCDGSWLRIRPFVGVAANFLAEKLQLRIASASYVAPQAAVPPP